MSAARPIALSGADQAIRAGQGTYRGIVVRETSGAATASIRVLDGTSTAGILIDSALVAAGGSYVSQFDTFYASGLFVDVVSGALEGSVLIG